MYKSLIGILIVFSTTIAAQEREIPNEVNKVFDFMLKRDFPEVFLGKQFQIRPIDWQVIDIDNDGKTEVFLQTFPHYRQSPTIMIYQIDKNDSINRITEGLAPGHLVKISIEDDYFDPHSTATAIDMQLGSNDIEKKRKFAEGSIKSGMSVVLYKNFIHTDKRDDNIIFLDMMHLDDYASNNTCEDFQFSHPDEIIAGKIKNQKDLFFLAKVDHEIFCYKIKGFDRSIFINKDIYILKTPSDFDTFQIDQGTIKYLNTKGHLIDFEL